MIDILSKIIIHSTTIFTYSVVQRQTQIYILTPFVSLDQSCYCSLMSCLSQLVLARYTQSFDLEAAPSQEVGGILLLKPFVGLSGRQQQGQSWATR